jgi:hypothetical protein
MGIQNPIHIYSNALDSHFSRQQRPFVPNLNRTGTSWLMI